MNSSRLFIAGLLLTAATQSCLAVTVEQFGTTRIYSSVDSDGVAFFTDIAPPEEAPPKIEPLAARGKPRQLAVSRDESVTRSVESTAPEARPDEPPANPLAEATKPENADGGKPPDDH